MAPLQLSLTFVSSVAMPSSVDVSATATTGWCGASARSLHLHAPSPPTTSWWIRWTAWRHDRCLMAPASDLLLLLVLSLALLSAVGALPSLLLGILLHLVLRRMSLLVEHLYPLTLARWGHVRLIWHSLRSTRQA